MTCDFHIIRTAILFNIDNKAIIKSKKCYAECGNEKKGWCVCVKSGPNWFDEKVRKKMQIFSVNYLITQLQSSKKSLAKYLDSSYRNDSNRRQSECWHRTHIDDTIYCFQTCVVFWYSLNFIIINAIKCAICVVTGCWTQYENKLSSWAFLVFWYNGLLCFCYDCRISIFCIRSSFYCLKIGMLE